MNLAASSATGLWWPWIAMAIVGLGMAGIEELIKRGGRRPR